MKLKEIFVEFSKAGVATLAIWFGLFSVYARYFEKKETIPIDTEFIAITFPLALSLLLIYITIRVYLRAKISFPVVIRYHQIYGKDSGNAKQIMFLLSPSTLFGSGVHCYIYHLDNDLEVLLGDGFVVNVQ